MAVPPALVVNFSFNPPVVSLAGPVQEGTITKLNALLPRLTTNSARGRRAPPQFERVEGPVVCWKLEMPALFSDTPSQMAMMTALLDCVEDEGGWGMRDTHSACYDYTDHYTFFFTKKIKR